MLLWLEIEGVRYEWDGRLLHCLGPDGPVSLPGASLSNLELEDEEGDLLGYLSVEPAQDRISFRSLASPDALVGQQILVGHTEGMQRWSLAALASEAPEHWGGRHMAVQTAQSLALDVVLDDVETLDVFFGAPSAPSSALLHEPVLTAWSPEPDSLPLFGDEFQYL